MLENLKLQDLFQKFFDNCIRVSFLLIFGALLSNAVIYHTVLHEDFQPWEKPLITHLEKYRIFSRVFDIVNQLLTRHSPFAPLGQVDEWTAKPSPFSIQGCLSECVRIMAAYRQWRSNFPRRERKPKYGKKNRQLRIQWLCLWHFTRLRTKIDNWTICHRPILAVYLKHFFGRWGPSQ